MTERLMYLLIILGGISFNAYTTWWHTGHYEYLMETFKMLQNSCNKKTCVRN